MCVCVGGVPAKDASELWGLGLCTQKHESRGQKPKEDFLANVTKYFSVNYFVPLVLRTH